ncbi:ferredoxin [Sinosporangium album]|uniref:Ferredoxin n=1 Tax=Sinosporangium album TaxID=504805 RepID=A0A1G7YEI0_9ACTN|nr:ferredoxin [Sinosporangium album]SDG94736.1 ferredoxin [Sinosporangium album]
MRVTTDTGRCVGAGQCVLAAPEVFDQDDDGTVALLTDSPPDEEHENVLEAVQRCPSLSIALGGA